MNITNSTLPWDGGNLVRVNQLPRGRGSDRGGGGGPTRRSCIMKAMQYEVDIYDEQISLLLLVSWMASGSVHLAGT